MKNYVIIWLSLTLLLCSCSARQEQPPEILEGKKIDVSSIYKKRGADLVEALYQEVVRNSDELKNLEKAIQEAKLTLQDSLEPYKTYNEKNTSYYEAAMKKAASITDSSIRKNILEAIRKSRENYVDTVASLRTMDSLLQKRTETLNNLHELLKIMATLPVIEDFQRTNLPQVADNEALLRKLDELIIQVDSLTRHLKPGLVEQPVEDNE
jgi:hypothetical protein